MLLMMYLGHCILCRFDQIAVVCCTSPVGLLSYRLRIIHPIVQLLSRLVQAVLLNPSIAHRYIQTPLIGILRI